MVDSKWHSKWVVKGQKLGVTDNIFREYDYLAKAVDNIPAKDFINSPLSGMYKEYGKSEFHTYSKEIRLLFEQMKTKSGTNVHCIYFKVICEFGG